ncbi:hypothetical protein GIB67_041859 [Kingdonia uniflora]|uniref:DUF2828 domain-containing protein n=1 Tax=Kingdonia uniflora TaxID=39325 RepID=A0A7J7L5T0_9MAGN|nr:hypothetical protein GIB67_041859 [Kingdonia uniflora]
MEEKLKEEELDKSLGIRCKATQNTNKNKRGATFFFHVVPKTPAESIVERLQLAWAHNPLKTLKLIYNLRGVRGTGKTDKQGFYTCALWLHGNHPKTLACNIWWFANAGYMKDLPKILFRLLEGLDARDNEKLERKAREIVSG